MNMKGMNDGDKEGGEGGRQDGNELETKRET